MRRYGLFTVGSLALAFSMSQASTRRHDVDDSAYIGLGNQYQSVGTILIGPTSFGSATLISSNWILFAAHLRDGGGGLSTGTFTLNGTPYEVSGIVNHPSWNGANGFDFALGFISAGVAGVAPSRYFAGPVTAGQLATSVGYGDGGTGLTGGLPPNGTRRGFTNIIDAVDFSPELPGFIADFDSPSGDSNTLGSIGSLPTPTDFEGNVTIGDSGGGLFMDFHGENVLIGVSSYVLGEAPPWGIYGHGSGWVSVASGADWIQQTSGVAPVPEPASLAALGIGALALWRRKRARA